VLVSVFGVGFGFGFGFGFDFGGAVDVLVVGAVLAGLAVLDVAGGLAAPVVLLACLEPPPPIASAAINTPES
jgi:high-affinity nickel permease